ncbi:class F sortase [Luteipulveratus sp. YIM 133132]|uniref:Class F sortase n=1 Tax=Luteipulveratus flavus TaxID=3031728 RepID=A0ABT6CFU5_9MICO|nr:MULTISPECIES: class F sortase [unclassified Luteipulveratus]MDE9364736.1 class F sortase [Luteipulveratus sp. YIM 133132]MDF8266156.1 class F sortase [Luteipulveratus sp. YIM 133296]
MALARSRRLAATTALAVAVTAGGAAAWATREPTAQSSRALAVPTSTSGARSADPTPTPTSVPTADPAGRRPVPTRVVVDRIGADLPLVALGVDRAGRMALPSSSHVGAWYRFGPAPGDTAGAVVVSSHVDSSEDGVGPLSRIGRLHRGDRITVRTSDGRSYGYRVERVVHIDKTSLDTGLLFSRSGPPRLHLVTCGGEFDRSTGHYEQNVVAVAAADRP